MSKWSSREINRTVEEIQRRTLLDPEFRALALSNPLAAIAKVNPRPLPDDISIRFVEESEGETAGETGSAHTIVLPEPLARQVELTDDELEEAAGGGGAPAPKLRS